MCEIMWMSSLDVVCLQDRIPQMLSELDIYLIIFCLAEIVQMQVLAIICCPYASYLQSSTINFFHHKINLWNLGEKAFRSVHREGYLFYTLPQGQRTISVFNTTQYTPHYIPYFNTIQFLVSFLERTKSIFILILYGFGL